MAEGVVDLGITGSDLVIEKRRMWRSTSSSDSGSAASPLPRMPKPNVIPQPNSAGALSGQSLSTRPRSTSGENGVDNVHIVEINGAVEVIGAARAGDGILDVVETGSSLREHDLVERETVLKAQAVSHRQQAGSESGTA